MLTIGLVTDLHFGPNARFEGRLRKLSERAPELVAAFVARMREIGPDLLVNLGDVVEDDTPERDRERYRMVMEHLAGAGTRVVSVAGNHDVVHLDRPTLRRMWGMSPDGPLYHSFDHAGHHVVVLYTHERKDLDVRIDAEQLAWLAHDLDGTQLPTVVLMHHSAADQDLSGNRWFERAPAICLVERRAELRALLAGSGRTAVVLNGHLHWNHLFIEGGIPYVTVQSLTENVHDDEPGEPAAAHALVRLDRGRLYVDVVGVHPARYEIVRAGEQPAAHGSR